MQSSSSTPTAGARQVSLAIDGMSCGHCVAAVTQALGALPGVAVQRVAVGAASVALDPEVSSTDAVIEAVREAGYDARVVERPLPQDGGGCCSTRQA